MKQTMLACALMLATGVAVAKDKPIPLSAVDATALRDKTVALTVHERPSFSAMTAGKATFGLFGAGAMISAGNKLVDENGIADPAITIREQFAAALGAAYGAQVQAPDATPTKATKPKELAALHPQADYVLDVRSGGWMYAYYPTDWNSYWVGYSVQVQLIDTKTARQVSNLACNANTNKHANPPSRDALHADGAKLLKDVTASLGWNCVQLLAKEQFNFPVGTVAATPSQWLDPQAAYAHSGMSNGSTPGNGMTPAARTTSNGMTPVARTTSNGMTPPEVAQPAATIDTAAGASVDAAPATEPTSGG